MIKQTIALEKVWDDSRYKARMIKQVVEDAVMMTSVFSIKAIGLVIVACHLKFQIDQKGIKSAFLNGYLKEEVYVYLPIGFEDPHIQVMYFNFQGLI